MGNYTKYRVPLKLPNCFRVCVCVFWQKLTKEFSEIDALFIQSNVMILSRIHDHEVFN